MALLVIEFYTDAPITTRDQSVIEGELVSSTEDTSLSTTVEHATVPGGALYATVNTDTSVYIEIGASNQDVASGRRSLVLANQCRGYVVRPGQVVSYRSVT